MKYIILLLILCLIVPIETYAGKGMEKTEYEIFFIGNSLTYYNDVPSMVSALISATNTEIQVEFDMVAEGGYSFAQHLELPIIGQMISNKKYDFIVIQDFGGWPFCSHSIPACSVSNDSLEEMIKIIKISGAIPLWYSTYQPNASVQKSLSHTVHNIAKQLKINVSDVGASLQIYLSKNSKDKIFSKDGHLNYTGSLIAAATIAQSIIGKISEDIKLREICTDNWRGLNLKADKLASMQSSQGITCKNLSQKDLVKILVASKTNH